nr:AarF/ABC1/UbiB kinase family protein [Knoellia sp. DB2414S]
MLSTRPDVVGVEVARELASLQSDVPPAPWGEVESALTSELGMPVGSVFASVDPVPLAAASVAQVHAATLLDGTPVVLKVQRPQARAQVRADLDIVLRLATWLDRTTVWGRSLGVLGLARGFAGSLDEELDYRVERANTEAIETSLRAAGSTVSVPRVYAAWSTSQLLVMERLAGEPLSRAERQLAGLSPEARQALADDLLRTVLRQVLVDGVFHADLHQGNVFLQPDGTLALLDFGAVGRLDSATSRALGVFLHAVDRNDSVAAADALLDVLDRPEDLDDRRFERELGTLVARMRTGFGAGGGAGVFTALFSLVLAHGFGVPPQVAAALRALGALEGTLATIDPGLDMVESARSHGRTLLADQFRPAQVRATLEDQLLTLAPVLQRLPRRLAAIGDQLEEGRLSVRVRLLAHADDRTFVEDALRQLTITLIAAACAICGVVLVVADTGPMMLPNLRLFTFVGATLFFFAFVLAARALARVFRPSRH